MKRKGQAAVEFLMTYGWAILAAIIAIGVLAYFGVFSPGKYVTDSAIVTAPFYVNAQNIQAETGIAGSNSGIVMELRNNGGEDLTVSSITITDNSAANIDCTWTGSQLVNPSGAVSFTIDCGLASLTAGNTYKGDVTISYTKTGSAVALASTGTIAGKITA